MSEVITEAVALQRAGRKLVNLPKTMPTSPGADEYAPSFSLSPRDVLDMRLEIEAAGVGALEDYERLQEERFRLARESMMRAIRMEAKRKNEARACAEKLATDLECERVRTSVYKFLALMGWIIFPVMWVVTR